MALIMQQPCGLGNLEPARVRDLWSFGLKKFFQWCLRPWTLSMPCGLGIVLFGGHRSSMGVVSESKNYVEFWQPIGSGLQIVLASLWSLQDVFEVMIKNSFDYNTSIILNAHILHCNRPHCIPPPSLNNAMSTSLKLSSFISSTTYSLSLKINHFPIVLLLSSNSMLQKGKPQPKITLRISYPTISVTPTTSKA